MQLNCTIVLLIYQVALGIETMLERKFLVGYSGHSFPIIEALNSMGFAFDGYFEARQKENNPYRLSFLGDENQFQFSEKDFVFVAIGNNYTRQKIIENLKNKVSLFSIIDSQSVVRSEISNNGIIVNAGVIIQSQCVIGKGVIVNTRAVIEHECLIGNFVHIAPGAVLAGNVSVGDCTLIGANSTVLPGVKIGKNCTIGAGSVVVKDVSDNSIIKGNPAK
jgi:sugar O-acyltransferase (sialic acid O-acetyltransferase NeuD family)